MEVVVALDTSPKVAVLALVDNLEEPFLMEHLTSESTEDNHLLEDQVTFKDYMVVASAQINQDSTEAFNQIILMVEDHLHLTKDAPAH